MQTTYAQKNETTQRAADNTAAAVHDNSPQSVSLQRHASLANAAVQRGENPPRPNNTGLPDDLKNGVESLSGYSLDNVRVHYNSPKPATVQALAYTQGTDIHVAPGQEHALPHEAWHVTQQMAGRVTPTTNIGGMPVNDNAALEHEADVMGEKAVQRKENGNYQQNEMYKAISCDLVQRIKVSDDHIAGDMKSAKGGKRLFDASTNEFFCSCDLLNKKTLTKMINENRGKVIYKKLRNRVLKDRGGMRKWLSEDGEHMYVHDGNAIHIASRGENEKLPHPTLVGGDPDAICAGTVEFDHSRKKIFVTNSSGHFRPKNVADETISKVKSICGEGKGKKKGDVGYRVEKREQ